MLKSLRRSAAAAWLALLSACGGGGSDPGPVAAGEDTVAKIAPYEGTWSLCSSVDGKTSARITMTLTRTSEAAANLVLTNQLHDGTTCTGAATAALLSITGKATAAGGRQVQGERVDRIDFQFDAHQVPGHGGVLVSIPAARSRQIFVIRTNGRLHYGMGDGAVFDLRDYPALVDAAFPFTRM